MVYSVESYVGLGWTSFELCLVQKHGSVSGQWLTAFCTSPSNSFVRTKNTIQSWFKLCCELKFQNSLFIFLPQQFPLLQKHDFDWQLPRLFLPQIVQMATKIQVLDSLTIKPIKKVSELTFGKKIQHVANKSYSYSEANGYILLSLQLLLRPLSLSKASHFARGRWWLVNACTLLPPNSFLRTKRTFGEQQEHLLKWGTSRRKILKDWKSKLEWFW